MQDFVVLSILFNYYSTESTGVCVTPMIIYNDKTVYQ